MGNIFAQNSCDSVVPKERDHRHYIQSLIPNNTCPNMFCFTDHVSGCYVVFVLNRIYLFLQQCMVNNVAWCSTKAFTWVDSVHLCKQFFSSLKQIASGDTINQDTICCRVTCSNLWIVALNTPWTTYRMLTAHVRCIFKKNVLVNEVFCLF